jgi:hypothetical protein
MRTHLLPVVLCLASPLAAQKALPSPRPLAAQTLVGGNVSGTWTRAGSPYRLVGTVVARELVVEAGVRVVGGPAASLVVRGSLEVEGTEAEPVVFTSVRKGSRWGGLEFDTASGSSRLQHARISRSADSGVRIVDSVVRFEHVVLEGNVAPDRGGGLRADVAEGDLVLLDCRVAGNVAGRVGGGMAVDLAAGSLVARRLELLDNAVNPDIDDALFAVEGGGLAVARASSVELTNAVVTGNTVDTASPFSQQWAWGGGLSVRDANLTMTRCIVSENRCWSIVYTYRGDSESIGGGLFYSAAGKSAQVRNSVFAGNEAALEANGGIACAAAVGVGAGSLGLSNCTIARNHMILGFGWTPDYGIAASGLMAQAGATATVENSILYENTYSGFLSLWYPPAQHQLVGNQTQAVFTDVQGALAGFGNVDLSPHFAGSGTSYADLSLAAASPCVDAGSPEALYDDVAFPPSLGTTRNDMGMNGGPLAEGWLALWLPRRAR